MSLTKFSLHIAIIAVVLLTVVACDKDFKTLESDILNPGIATNFINKDSLFNVVTYFNPLGLDPSNTKPIQTNNLSVNAIGVYEDYYGQTLSSLVTQLRPLNFDPAFKTKESDEIVLDSVTLTIPYFSTITGLDAEGGSVYELDSVFLDNSGHNTVKLSLFESNYFIRDFNPNGNFEETQPYFSNKSASTSENIPDGTLENTPIPYFTEIDSTGSPMFLEKVIISSKPVELKEINAEGDTITTQVLAPSLRIRLETDYWKTKIIEQEGSSVLSSQSNFSEYFRGLYFKAEMPGTDDGNNYMLLNLGTTNANITLHFTQISYISDGNGNPTSEIESETQSSFTLNFGPNTINFFDNDFTSTPFPSSDAINGDERIYLKGGEGSIARIKLFNGEGIDDDETTDNAFETWKKQFVLTDENGNYVESKRLVNEANLVFYVDQNTLSANNNHNEPHRLYIYDAQNNTPLIDYFLDVSNPNLPEFSRITHLVPLEREDSMDGGQGKGIKYKFRITEHINNLLLKDSTNVELGLSVSLNPNLEEFNGFRQIQTLPGSEEETLPISAVVSPKGTILYGNKATDDTKKVYLEISYTCILDDENCATN